MRFVVVAAFGALGALSRYAVDGAISRAAQGQFPIGTLVINVVGSFALGALVELTTNRMVLPAEWRIALGVGFLGAFTTFSTFSYETVRMLESGALAQAVLNVVASVVLGVAAALFGVAVAWAV
ncbi:Putative fluoride ion transporter CrcB [bacterium HR41]|nr:Putative fluoride ion transporter CrcB [bacterium HR41]